MAGDFDLSTFDEADCSLLSSFTRSKQRHTDEVAPGKMRDRQVFKMRTAFQPLPLEAARVRRSMGCSF